MKKLFLLLLVLITYSAFLVNAQDTIISVFDDGVLGWSTWGAPLSIEANPSKTKNLSDSAALLDQKGGAWSGMANWNNNSLLDSTVVAIAVDAYFANTGGTLKLQCDNSISGARNIEKYADVGENVWTEVIFNISTYDTLDYKQIAFQSSVADSLFIDNIRILRAAPADAGNLIKGGSMENAAAWNFYWGTNGNDNFGLHEFNYTGDTADAGNNGSYKVTGKGRTASFIWQPVTLMPYHIYELSGAFKNISADSVANTWIEIILKKTMPTGADVGLGAGEYRYRLDTWGGAEALNIDGTFQDDFLTDGGDLTQIKLPADAPTQWYLVIKAGSWNEGAYQPTFDVIFDEISLVDLGLNPILPLDNLIVGTVDDADDFTGNLNITWDVDSVYMFFDIVDDSISRYLGGSGGSYQADNIEIYFDMDNSKNIHYPRNGGWTTAVDPTYDDNDFQFRLVPDSAFSVNNNKRPTGTSISGGYKQVYTQTASGYQFNLHVAWDSLLADFDATIGTEIGFDVLISDNDAVVSDANRNQLTWNSPFDKPYNDPSLFGTLILSADNAFTPKLDTEAPTAPTNLAVTAADTVFSWDAAEDNICVNTYIVYNGNTAVDTIYAKTSENKFTFKGLADGDYTFGVVAVDNYGLKSTKSTLDVTVAPSSVDITKASIGNVYPNPSTGIVYIVAADNKTIEFVVYNITGTIVRSGVFTESQQLELSGGMYFIHLKSADQSQVSKVIVK